MKLITLISLMLSVLFMPVLASAQVSRGPESSSILFDTGREALASTNQLLLFAIIGTIAIIVIWKKLTIKHKKFIGPIIGIVWIIVLITSVAPGSKMALPTHTSTDWQNEYETARLKAGIEDKYVIETNYYDYNKNNIKEIIAEIEKDSYSPEEATKKTLDYVFNQVTYDIKESDAACFDGTGSSIIQKGIGQCDTQSIAVITILRGMGLAARPVGGCIARNPSCQLKFSLLQAFGTTIKEPRFTPLNITELDPKAKWFSRAVDARKQIAFSRLGGLHAWAQVWLPEKGWVALEPTAGEFSDISCYYYHVELFPENDDKEALCVSTNYKYALACAADDFDTMNQEGVGLLK